MSQPPKKILQILFLFLQVHIHLILAQEYTCPVAAAQDPSIDDVPSILHAFEDCNQHAGGRAIFTNTTYHINSILDTQGLRDITIEIHGRLLWSPNTTYWLTNSLPVGYQNQSTAWILGGTNVRVDGFGYGTIDGNGQVWYDFVKGESNYPRRPHGVTFRGLNGSVVTGLRFVGSQMWWVFLFFIFWGRGRGLLGFGDLAEGGMGVWGFDIMWRMEWGG
ncbi:hypothetical protein HYALB_00006404 [Hymenoscyphus albidus]|uniref:Uncharacterized protein n=1 Tax=Hymenoscyphus albidus TaxID=595503 RepID=A0A9N9Q080_9HELO|nr:hypothetical protein HYALB_00006404 [Hymenoscyphus albidus]